MTSSAASLRAGAGMSLLEMCEAHSDTHQTMKRETIVPKLGVSCPNSNYIIIIFMTKENQTEADEEALLRQTMSTALLNIKYSNHHACYPISPGPSKS